ncbi:MAG: RagB/SusD family nutrient uptake outer membrane protein [Flavobacteriaceae bacterium]
MKPILSFLLLFFATFYVSAQDTTPPVWPNEVKTGVAADLVVGTQQHNKDEILSERRKELCFEGWRRNDLVRNGVYYEAINSSQPIWSNSGNPQPQYTPNEIRWPIPASELQINSKLVQNEGYD